jgi:threonine dehydrogenase-like Zn-dependent dehydrogenase
LRSLIAQAAGQVAWQEVAEPQRRHEREALVRPLAVAMCDLDLPLIWGVVPTYEFPIELGHECVAEVVEGPEGFAPGDLVVVPFQISCSTCARCRRGLTGFCETSGPLSMYGFGPEGGGWGGMLSDLALVPYADAMLVPLPENIEPATVASAADNIADGWRSVAPALADLPCADVLIAAGGAVRSIQLYATDVALALGAATVTYVDTDPHRLRVAEELGARVVEGALDEALGTFPITVDATGSPDGLVATLARTDWGGRCTSIGHMTLEAPMPLWEMYRRGVTWHIGPGQARPAIPAILDLVAAGRLRPELVTSATATWDDAEEAVLEPTTKLVISRD